MNLIPLLKTKISKILITIIISTVLIISVVLIVVTNSNSKNNTESRIKQEHIAMSQELIAYMQNLKFYRSK